MRILKVGVAIGVVVVLMSATTIKDKYFEIAKNLEIFTNIYKELNAGYVDQLEPNQLMRTAIDAMMHSLDPYTVYYSESQVENYKLATDGKYNGLGAGSQDIDGVFTITEVYDNGPAHEAGILVGDQVKTINGKTTEGRTYKEILQFIRGVAGTSVDLTIYRPTTGETIPMTLKRSNVKIPNVPYSGLISEDVAYINLTTFTNRASDNIAKALRDMRDSTQLSGLVLDLRNNGGGLLSEAVNIVGLFMPKGTLAVTTKGKIKENNRSYNTRNLPIDTDLPIVVLVNNRSASASEIVSGNIQDHDRGVVMGQRTYGKGLVQNFKDLGYNSRMKLTTAKYYIPSGRCIQSVAYENGEPKDIADDKRAVFYTANNRPVLDGGGITPDIKLPTPEDPPVLQELKKQHLIFKYCNEYVHKHERPDSFELFSFDAYDDFLKYVKKQDFEFDLPAENTLVELESTLDDDMLGKLKSLKNALESEKSDDLQQYRSVIADEIEAELAKRYFYQEGQTRQMLKNDSEVVEAIALLKDKKQYNSILGK